MRTLLSSLLLLAPAATAQQPNPWIFLHSAETATPPRLVLTLTDGTERELAASMDTVLIGYLADRAFAGHRQLAIDAADANHTLLRFRLPADLGGAGALARAELLVRAAPGTVPPRGATTFEVHRIEADWDAAAATWAKAPPHGAEAVAVARVPHGGGEVRVDVTPLARGWLGTPSDNFGVLLRNLRDDGPPVAPPAVAPPADPGAETPLQRHGRLMALAERTAAAVPWHSDAQQALAAARREHELVFAFVVADPGRLGSTHERALCAAALLLPDVRELLAARFVPLRLATRAFVHLGPEPPDEDPLAALGTDAVTAKAPALVVCTGTGEAVAVLGSIGTWSGQLVAGFLLHALRAAPPAGPPAGAEAPAAPLAAALDAVRRGELSRARELAAALPPADAARVGLRIATLRGDAAAVQAALAELAEAGGQATPDDALRAAPVLLAAGDVAAAGRLLEERPGAEGSAALAALQCCRAELLWHRGERDAARSTWRAAAAADPDSPWGRRAELLAEHAAAIEELAPAMPVAYAESLRTTERPRTAAERDALVRGAVGWLLARQRPDGSFPHPGQPEYHAAVTALVAKALDACRGRLPEALQTAAQAAVARAERWCGAHLAAVEPRTADSFGAAYLVDFLVARAARSEAARELVPAAIGLLLGGQLDNGAWSYNRRFGEQWRGGFGGWPKTDRGRAHSINTGMALWALAAARAAGFAVPDDALGKGVAALQQMQITPTTFTYTWPDPRCFDGPDQSIGKAPVCLQALVALGAAPERDLERAVAEFLQWRGGLRATVKLTGAWMGPGGTSSYFFLHATYHAAEAIAAAGGEEREARLAALRDDLLACAEVDGTWLDYEDSGKTYGTAMALLVLARAP